MKIATEREIIFSRWKSFFFIFKKKKKNERKKCFFFVVFLMFSSRVLILFLELSYLDFHWSDSLRKENFAAVALHFSSTINANLMENNVKSIFYRTNVKMNWCFLKKNSHGQMKSFSWISWNIAVTFEKFF